MVFTINRSCTVATVRIWDWSCNTGDPVGSLVWELRKLTLQLLGLNNVRKILDRGEAGWYVGYPFEEVLKNPQSKEGWVICKPGSVKSTTLNLEALKVYILKKKEGGNVTSSHSIITIVLQFLCKNYRCLLVLLIFKWVNMVYACDNLTPLLLICVLQFCS